MGSRLLEVLESSKNRSIIILPESSALMVLKPRLKLLLLVALDPGTLEMIKLSLDFALRVMLLLCVS